MDAKNKRDAPYPKRIKSLIVSYQKKKNEKDLHKIFELVDKLVIKIIQDIYKYETYSYLKNYEANEIYSTAFIAFEKVVSKIQVDERFTIGKLSSYLNGYIGKEFQLKLSNKISYVSLDEVENGYSDSSINDFKQTQLKQETPDESLDLEIPGFPKQAVDILRKSIIHQMSLQEIADELGINKGHVRYWVNRGKEVLRKIIVKERKSHLWRL